MAEDELAVAKVEKNKVGVSFREADFSIIQNYGIDDLQNCLDYLKKVGGLDDVGYTEAEVKHGVTGLSKLVRSFDNLDDAEYKAKTDAIYAAVTKHWHGIESTVQRKRRKYG